MRTLAIIALLTLLTACSPQGGQTPDASSTATASVPATAKSSVVASPSEKSKTVVLGWAPEKACGFIGTGFGVSVRPYHRLGSYDETYGCATSYKTLGSGFPLANNLAYYVTGSQHLAIEVKLVLNVNVRSTQAEAKRELKKFSSVITQAATGIKLPTDIANAISTGSPKVIEKHGYKLQLTRDDWPTGKGYELHFAVTKVKKG